MTLAIKLIYDYDGVHKLGDSGEIEVHEIVLKPPVRIFNRDGQLVIAADESNEKW